RLHPDPSRNSRRRPEGDGGGARRARRRVPRRRRPRWRRRGHGRARGRRADACAAAPERGTRDRLGRIRARAAHHRRARGHRRRLAVRALVRRRRRARVSSHARRARGPGLGRPRASGADHRDRVRRNGRQLLPLRDGDSTPRKPGGRWGGRLVPPIVQKLTWASLIHVVVSGLATGSIYALMALALVIIYNATRTLNFAQGEMLMVSTFIGWAAQRAFGLPLGVTLLVAVLAGAILAFLVERLVIRRAIGATHWDLLIITLGLSLVLRAAAGLAWTHDEFPFPSFFGTRPIALGPVRLAPVSLGIVGASLTLMLGLWALFTRTRLGRAMRAVAQNQRAARLVGISVERVYAASWVLASVVGAIAGVLIAPVIFLSSQMGFVTI